MSISDMVYLAKEIRYIYYTMLHVVAAHYLTSTKLMADNKGTFISSVSTSTNLNLNSEIYIAWYGKQTTRPKRNFTHIDIKYQRNRQ
jgi:phosphoribosylaminoimidazole carboxylase (NCAIR synthetase)